MNSPMKNPGGIQLSLAYFLLATVYMFSPKIANFLTRLSTKEGKANLTLQPKFKQGQWLCFRAY